MDKESIFELQKVDCNCNDCVFMIRDIDKYKKSVELHYKWQLGYFNTMRQKLIDKAKWWRYVKGDLEKYNDLSMEADAKKFQFDKRTALIHYGRCDKLDKEVSFLPNILQLETQSCFTHRRNADKQNYP